MRDDWFTPECNATKYNSYVSLRTYRTLGQALMAIGALAIHSRDYTYSEWPQNVSSASPKIVKL